MLNVDHCGGEKVSHLEPLVNCHQVRPGANTVPRGMGRHQLSRLARANQALAVQIPDFACFHADRRENALPGSNLRPLFILSRPLGHPSPEVRWHFRATGRAPGKNAPKRKPRRQGGMVQKKDTLARRWMWPGQRNVNGKNDGVAPNASGSAGRESASAETAVSQPTVD